MRNTMIKILLLSIAPIVLFAQEDFYPKESFYGGGVGFSQMYLFTEIGNLDGFELLSDSINGLGLKTSEFKTPFVINGGEGFSHITGRWRIGGYAGVGSSFIGGKTDVNLFIDTTGNGRYDTGEVAYKYEGEFAPDVQAKISMWIGGGTVEYVLPIFKGLEIAGGALMGLGRVTLNITHTATQTSSWDNQFGNIYGNNGYYEVTDLDGDGDVDNDDVEILQNDYVMKVTPSGGSMTSLTGTFFNMQPYLAMKLQFLDRVGLRLSVGFNIGKINQGTWTLNNGTPISDSPATQFNALAVRAMLYFGL